MTNEDIHNLYSSIDTKNLNEFERYKYLTENDVDIIKQRQQVKKMEIERKLSSLMNDTKWLELQKGIKNLPFAPAYNAKLILWNEDEVNFGNFNEEPSYYGNWSNYWEEGLPIFFTIEWLEIRPKYKKYQGRLVPPKIIDETKELINLLNNLNIPFENKNGSIFIYGYK